MAPATAATPMALIRAIVRAYEKYDRDPVAALQAAQIAPSELHRSDARVTAAQMEAISAHAMRELDDEALGWFSRRLPWGSHGLLCRASIGAPDLGVALRRWCHHLGLLVPDIAMSLQVRDGRAELRLEERRRLGAFREIALLTCLRNVHGFACWLIDSRLPLAAIEFPYPRPPHHAAYALMFPGPVAFAQPMAGFSFDAQYLAQPLRRDEAALRTMLQRPLPLTVRPYRRDRLLAQQVRALLRDEAHVLRTAEALADRLHVSARTLHRQLQAEGETLQGLRDAVRRDEAVALLQRSRRPVQQVAAAVGFRSEKSFARAFRQWTGESPSECRRRSLPAR